MRVRRGGGRCVRRVWSGGGGAAAAEGGRENGCGVKEGSGRPLDVLGKRESEGEADDDGDEKGLGVVVVVVVVVRRVGDETILLPLLPPTTSTASSDDGTRGVGGSRGVVDSAVRGPYHCRRLTSLCSKVAGLRLESWRFLIACVGLGGPAAAWTGGFSLSFSLLSEEEWDAKCD